jgi:cyclase
MKKIRVVPRLDVKGPDVVKGVHLEGLRIIGDPGEIALEYYRQGADELIYIDSVASLYRRSNLVDIVDSATEDIFIPITVGGGVRNIDDIRELLSVGADKVAINTAATHNPKFISDAAERFGSQCIVGSIEAKQMPDGSYECFIENGREPTGLDTLEWALRLEELGAGEILLTSIDREGTRDGYDVDLVAKVTEELSIPVIACGGAGDIDHIEVCIKEGRADAVGIASMLHYNDTTIPELKSGLVSRGIEVRQVHE